MFVENIEIMEIIKNFINEMIDELQDKMSTINRLKTENQQLKQSLDKALKPLQKDKALETQKDFVIEQQAISLDELQKENEGLRKALAYQENQNKELKEINNQLEERLDKVSKELYDLKNK